MSRRGGEKRRISFGDGERRRSPRLFGSISASPQNEKKADCNNQANNNNNNSINTRARKTTSKELFGFVNRDSDNNHQCIDKKLVPLPRSRANPELKLPPKLPCPLNSCEQDDRAPNRCDDHSKDDESWLPNKSILELVLDTLQRRDTHDIFAEPVDPSEVQEYYEIIKEPMDFGTMRAKLHEGMYKNIQQFEHDVYLIFENAMHFNSSSTVYFRQARVMEDLAKNIFFVLKNDPKNFKMHITAIRRKSSRRFDGEQCSLTFGSPQKLAKDLGSNTMHIDLGRKGFGKERKSCLPGVIDRRSTYKPWIICLFDEASSAISPLFCGTKSLIYANQGESGYKESLMSFAKNLGPTAHRVAKNKLQGLWIHSPSSSRSHMNGWDNSSAHNNQALVASSQMNGGMLSRHLNIMVPVVKETKLEQLQTGYNFDLNQGHAIPSPNYLVGSSYEENSKNREVKSCSGLVEAAKFNRLYSTAPATTLYKNTKLGDEVVENNSTLNGQLSTLQLPPVLNSSSPSPIASKINFGKASDGYTNQNHGFYVETII